MLCDTGPLVAILDRSDVYHERCMLVIAALHTPLVTTWACFVEAMYLLGRYSSFEAQDALWRYVEEGALLLHISTEAEQRRMRVLMQNTVICLWI